MRRTDRELPLSEAEALLEKCEYGTLSLVTPENAPYSVPVSYVYADGAIYIHCATEGRKLDCLKANPRAVFSVVGNTKIVEGKFTTLYESTIAEGNAALIENPEEKRTGLMKICVKYYPEMTVEPDAIESMKQYIEKYFSRTAVIKISGLQITGKANR